MSRILSFSADNEFAATLDDLVKAAGYSNRSMFLRDASQHYAEVTKRGDLAAMNNDEEVEGTLVIYYQHGVENKLLELRHSHAIEVSSYNHQCLTNSHTCVDTMHIHGSAQSIRNALEKLHNTKDIDRVAFVAAPMRSEGCC
jgi:metal-responsive CopG/Arc/MetJ family transcriptional regulator